MAEILNSFTLIMNLIHELIVTIVSKLGFDISDKIIHFLFMGIVGLIIFILVDITFKKLVNYGVSILSFIYTFSAIIVVSLIIEIQQKVTGEGNMEFADIVYGIGGFLLFFLIFIGITLFFRKVFKKNTKRKRVKKA